MRTSILLAIVSLVQPLAFSADLKDLRIQIRTTLHVPGNSLALREKSYGQFTPAPGIAADRVSYYTDYDLRIPAIVYHQAGATVIKHPGLVIVNGQGGDKSSSYAYWAGILYARAGAVVLTFDPLGEFERNRERRSGTRQSDGVVQPVEEMRRRLQGLMVSDVLQGVHYLSSRKDVDAKNIAVLSFDSGALTAAVACALNADIRACVTPEGVSAEALLGAAGNATLDELTPKRRFAHGSGPDPSLLTRPVAQWLNEKLKFPDWSKKQIASMPETRMGNIQALGDPVPAIPRDDLHAVPDAVWSAEQEGFIYESWVERAKAAIRTGAP